VAELERSPPVPAPVSRLEDRPVSGPAARDVAAVEAILRVLTVVDPNRAELVYDAIRLGIAIRTEAANRMPPDSGTFR
jgi:hypothetical protein